MQCCVWVRTQTAYCGETRASLLRLGSWWVGSCQTARHSCRAHLRFETRSALNPRVSGWKSRGRVSMLVGSTYLLTPWCRVLLEQLTGLQLVKKFRKIAFINLTRKNTQLSGGCFRAQFDIPFGPGFSANRLSVHTYSLASPL